MSFAGLFPLLSKSTLQVEEISQIIDSETFTVQNSIVFSGLFATTSISTNAKLESEVLSVCRREGVGVIGSGGCLEGGGCSGGMRGVTGDLGIQLDVDREVDGHVDNFFYMAVSIQVSSLIPSIDNEVIFDTKNKHRKLKRDPAQEEDINKNKNKRDRCNPEFKSPDNCSPRLKKKFMKIKNESYTINASIYRKDLYSPRLTKIKEVQKKVSAIQTTLKIPQRGTGLNTNTKYNIASFQRVRNPITLLEFFP
ncbi:hypothetical protein RND71_034413 [Anisodus tanguticus]|uniref:Plastid lipid-associated protein/fibrillin conserved domain-containing protein n=1 Tax=Anisodus tanguticus TaxID=243964 RepID=A0AAE1R9J1_9SOLA|nr:hypothetical protein RND71_034413 [Anisodus tanguticus]